MKKLFKRKSLFIILAFVCVAIVAVSAIVLSSCVGDSVKKASKNLSTYTINAALNEEFVIEASQNLKYINSTGATLDNICLHLYPRAFREEATIKPYTTYNQASCFPNGISFGDLSISRVDINGSSANFEYTGTDQDILQINLDTSLPNKKSVSIDIDFNVIIPESTHRLGYYNGTINVGNWYPIVCGYDNGWDTSAYYSTGDPFFSESANYSVEFSYLDGYDCFATGNVESAESNKQKYSALAVRDFALVLSNKSQVETSKVGKTSISYVGYSGDSDIPDNLDVAKTAVEYFNKTFGNYPFKNLVVIKSAFVQGGMEYPNIVIISDAITEPDEFKKVIVHEIAHQWWYSAVGNNEVKESWLDESLAEYSTCLFFEENSKYNILYQDLVKDAISSYLIYVDVIGSLSGKVNTAMNLALNEYANEYEYTYMVYVKGVIMFDSLRDVVGKNKLFSALKHYYKQNMFKVAKASDFIDCMKKHCHKDLDNFFDGWLNGNSVVGYID